jgi:hypothetical protein
MAVASASASHSLYFCSRQSFGLQVLGGRQLTNARISEIDAKHLRHRDGAGHVGHQAPPTAHMRTMNAVFDAIPAVLDNAATGVTFHSNYKYYVFIGLKLQSDWIWES